MLLNASVARGQRIKVFGKSVQWNYFRTVDRMWGPYFLGGYSWRLYFSLGHLTLWVGHW